MSIRTAGMNDLAALTAIEAACFPAACSVLSDVSLRKE